MRLPLVRIGGGRCILIDSGLPESREGILELLDRAKLRVAAILTSHTHIDHVGNHRAIKEAHGAELFMSRFDAVVMSNPLCLKAYLYNMSYREACAFGKDMLVPADHIFDYEDDFVEVCGVRFKILHLEGHAPEHKGYVTPDGVAYLSDTILSESVVNSIRIPFCFCHELDLRAKNEVHRMDYESYILAHNAVYRDVRAITEKNIILPQHRYLQMEQIATQWRTIDEMVAIGCQLMGVYKETIPKRRLAEQNIRSMIEHLLDTGRLKRRFSGGRIQYMRSDRAD